MRKLTVRVACALLLLSTTGLGLVYLLPGYDMFFLRSQSMRPALNLGDLIVTGPPLSPLTPSLKPGTIITFKIGKGVVTHRIHAVVNGETVVTKGDALEDPDPRPVSTSSIMGVYMFKIPLVGYLTSFARTRTGWFLTIILPAMVLVSLIVRDILRETFRTEDQDGRPGG